MNKLLDLLHKERKIAAVKIITADKIIKKNHQENKSSNNLEGNYVK